MDTKATKHVPVNMIIGNGSSMPEKSDEVEENALAQTLLKPIAVEANRVGKIMLFEMNTLLKQTEMPNFVTKMNRMKIRLS